MQGFFLPYGKDEILEKFPGLCKAAGIMAPEKIGLSGKGNVKIEQAGDLFVIDAPAAVREAEEEYKSLLPASALDQPNLIETLKNKPVTVRQPPQRLTKREKKQLCEAAVVVAGSKEFSDAVRKAAAIPGISGISGSVTANRGLEIRFTGKTEDDTGKDLKAPCSFRITVEKYVSYDEGGAKVLSPEYLAENLTGSFMTAWENGKKAALDIWRQERTEKNIRKTIAEISDRLGEEYDAGLSVNGKTAHISITAGKIPYSFCAEIDTWNICMPLCSPAMDGEAVKGAADKAYPSVVSKLRDRQKRWGSTDMPVIESSLSGLEAGVKDCCTPLYDGGNRVSAKRPFRLDIENRKVTADMGPFREELDKNGWKIILSDWLKNAMKEQKKARYQSAVSYFESLLKENDVRITPQPVYKNGILHGKEQMLLGIGKRQKLAEIGGPDYRDGLTEWKKAVKKQIENFRNDIRQEEKDEFRKAAEAFGMHAESCLSFDICRFVEKNDRYITPHAISQYLRGLTVQLNTFIEDTDARGRYNAIGADVIEKRVYQMANLGVLATKELKGTYGRFDVVHTGKKLDLLKKAFGNYPVRKEKEIERAAKNGMGLSDQECSVYLSSIKEPEIKDYAILLGMVASNLTFVCHDHDRYMETFRNAPDPVLGIVKMKKTMEQDPKVKKVYSEIEKTIKAAKKGENT